MLPPEHTNANRFWLRPAAPPYRLDLTTWALRRRRRNEVDRWDGAYQRVLMVEQRAIPVEATQLRGPDTPVLQIDVLADEACSRAELIQIRENVARLLGVDVDLSGFHHLTRADPRTRDLVHRFQGVHPPRFPSLFEAAANAVANQQLSLEVGLTLLNRLTAAFGSRATGLGRRAAFPTAEAVLEAGPERIRTLGFSSRKATYLGHIAHAAVAGALNQDKLKDLDRTGATECLMGIRGIGRWSAEYILLRGMGRLDVFPGDDVGARNRLRRFFSLDHDPGYDEIGERLRPWRPYAGLLYFHLLLEGLAERGELADVGF